MYIVHVDDVKVTYQDYQYTIHILGDETEAAGEQEALRNVLFSRYTDWPRARIAYVYKQLLDRGAYEAYDLDMLEDVETTPGPEVDDQLNLFGTMATIKETLAGKWGYGPYDSDAAKDYAWQVEIDLLEKALDVLDEQDNVTTRYEEVGVILDLLSHIDNNSLDEAQELYTELRTRLLEDLNAWAVVHDEPDEARKLFLDLLDRVEERMYMLEPDKPFPESYTDGDEVPIDFEGEGPVPEAIASIKQAIDFEYNLRTPVNTPDLGLRRRDYDLQTNKQQTGLQHPEFHEQDLVKEPDY